MLLNVTWSEDGIEKKSIGLEPKIAARLLWELEIRKGIKGRFTVAEIG